MSDSAERRLNSWKEIAAYFGKDERTVKRWEGQRGLPVHRIPGGARGRVFAYAEELDRWLKGVDMDGQVPSGPARLATRVAEGRIWRPGVTAIMFITILSLATGLGVARLSGYGSGTAASATGTRASGHEPPAEALELYLSGSFNLEKRTPDSLRAAEGQFRAAIAKDPGYAEAYVGLANCYNLLREYTTMPASEAYPLAEQAAEKALAINDRIAEAHTALAFVKFYFRRDTERAIRAFERSTELDPESVRARHWFATALLHTGAFERSLKEINVAQRLDPQSRSIRADKGLILFYAGQTEEAISLLTSLAQSEPDYLSPFAYLSAIYFAEGRYADYLNVARKAAQLIGDPNRTAVLDAAERAFAAGGGKAMLEAMLGEQKRLFAVGRESAWRLAQTRATMGDEAGALAELRASLDLREEYAMAIRIEPAFRPLHRVEAFRSMVREVGMPPL